MNKLKEYWGLKYLMFWDGNNAVRRILPHTKTHDDSTYIREAYGGLTSDMIRNHPDLPLLLHYSPKYETAFWTNGMVDFEWPVGGLLFNTISLNDWYQSLTNPNFNSDEGAEAYTFTEVQKAVCEFIDMLNEEKEKPTILTWKKANTTPTLESVLEKEFKLRQPSNLTICDELARDEVIETVKQSIEDTKPADSKPRPPGAGAILT